MNKKIFLLSIWISFLALCACSSDRFVLDNQYYNQWEFIQVNTWDITSLKSWNYVLFTYNNYCALKIPCDEIFKKFMQKYNIDFLSINYENFKKTHLHDTVQYAPSIIIVKNWKVIAYLDTEKDGDLEKYQDVNEFEKWISKYVILKKE